MKGQRLRKHIISNTAHLHSIRCEEPTPIDKNGSNECHGIVALRHDKHADDFLVSIYDKVAAHLSHVFMALYQLFFCHAFQVTELRANHHWNVS
jgi:hypothetical protein